MANDSSDAVDPELPAPSTQNDIELDRRARKKRMAVGGAVIVVALGGGGFGFFQWQDAQAAARVDAAWASFGRCLLGDPLAAGEHASLRLRAVQLTAMTLPEPQRAPADGQPWPTRCAPLGHAVAEALKDGGRAKGGDAKDLAYFCETLAKGLKEPAGFSADLSEAVDRAWSAADDEKVGTAKPNDIERPPVAAEAYVLEALARVEPMSKTSFSLRSTYAEPHPGKVLRLLVEEKGVPRAPFVCTFTATDAAARCAPLPSAITATHQGLRLLGTAEDDAAPLVFAGNRGKDGVFRADTGELVDKLYSYSGYSTKDGFSSLLGYDDEKKELVLVRKAAGGAAERTVLKPDFRIDNYFYSSQILWDEVLLRGVTKEEQRRLFAEKVPKSGAVGEPVDVGELPEPGLVVGGADEPPHIAGCRTSEAMVVRVKGYDNDFMSFLVGGKWTQPISPEITGGTLSCGKAEAAITRVEPAAADTPWKTSITEVRCTTAGCKSEVVRMEQLASGMLDFAPKENHVDATTLDGKLLVVWAAGERGGVRMRFAPADQIAKAKDVVLFDDLVKDGQVQKLSTLFELRLLSRDGFAVLLLNTVGGVHALRIDPDGKVTPVKADWAK